MGISVNALDLIPELARRDAEREVIVQEHLVALYLLTRCAGGRVEIPLSELQDLPSLQSIALSTTVVDHPEHGKTAIIEIVKR